MKPRPAGDLPAGEEPVVTGVPRHADFDGGKKADTVVRTHRGGTADLIALHPSAPRSPRAASPSPRRSSPAAGAAPYGPPASPETP
ncbi:hypothetical protein [Streptomyces sp. Wb2n-11]|uniref:hypothetical protein n=1 Tax=Streptomyces sp. Wb2n-11 TaxID=1030533 RepID=UPI000AE94D68|nr:hypothetical protein [Streptomyces sp. Wb2n-11]